MIHLCRKEHVKILDYMMQELSAEQQRWVIRIILKGSSSPFFAFSRNQLPDIFLMLDLKAGVREKTVLAAFHPQAIELFNVSSDLKRVCYTLSDPHFRLDQKVKSHHPHSQTPTLIPSIRAGLPSKSLPPFPPTTMQTSGINRLDCRRQSDAAETIHD